MILMSLCVLYQRHCREIRGLFSLPYWLKLIQDKDYEPCQFILL